MLFPDLLLYRIITFPNTVLHLFSVSNLMGMNKSEGKETIHIPDTV